MRRGIERFLTTHTGSLPRMKSLALLVALAIITVPLGAAVDAQEYKAGKVYRIGVLALLAREQVSQLFGEVDKGLRELGYVEGRNLAAELVRLKVDVIVAANNTTIGVAKQATTSIPIVMVHASDPLGAAFVKSLARPGGNITGSSIDVGAELFGKRLELLKELAPRISRVAFVRNPAEAGSARDWDSAVDAGRRLGVTIQSVEIRRSDDLDAALATIVRERADGLLVSAGPIVLVINAKTAKMLGLTIPLSLRTRADRIIE